MFGFRGSASATFRFEGRIEGSEGCVFLDRDAVSAVRGIRIAWMRDVKEVGMFFAEKVFEKGIDVHSPHPSFQSDGVLLYLLRRLTFGNVRWLNSKV